MSNKSDVAILALALGGYAVIIGATVLPWLIGVVWIVNRIFGPV